MIKGSENVDSVYNFFCSECDDPEEELDLNLLEKKLLAFCEEQSCG